MLIHNIPTPKFIKKLRKQNYLYKNLQSLKNNYNYNKKKKNHEKTKQILTVIYKTKTNKLCNGWLTFIFYIKQQ